MKEAVRTTRAPAAVGPYAQAIVSQGLVFASGQVALDPGTGRLVEGGIEAEAAQALANLRAVLEAAGSELGRVLRTTVYLTDMREFEAMNRVYAATFSEPYPARTTVEVSRLPRGARFEIDAVARV